MRYRAEILTAVTWLAGWALVTLAVVELTHAPRIVWPASAGLLCLGLGGFRLLGRVVGEGLYVLTREDAENG